MKKSVAFSFFALWSALSLADPHPPSIYFDSGVVVYTNEAVVGELKKKYPLRNLVDGDHSTAWVYERREGTPKISIKLPQGLSIDKIGLINGYAKSESIYTGNNRIKEISLTINEDRARWLLADHNREAQYYELPPHVVGKLELLVAAVYPGDKHNDTCISELALFSGGVKLPSENYVVSSGGEYPDYTVYLSGKSFKKFPSEMISDVLFVNGGTHIVMVNENPEMSGWGGITIINVNTHGQAALLK